jgi:hypothetical protein
MMNHKPRFMNMLQVSAIDGRGAIRYPQTKGHAADAAEELIAGALLVLVEQSMKLIGHEAEWEVHLLPPKMYISGP